MASKRRAGPPQPSEKGPTISASQALTRLRPLADVAMRTINEARVTEEAHRAWQTKARHFLESAFGEGDHKVSDVLNAGSRRVMDRSWTERERNSYFAGIWVAQLGQLKSVIDILELEAQDEAESEEPAQEGKMTNTTNETTPAKEGDPKKVFIIYGRNAEAKKQMGIFLKSMGLNPLNFEDVRASLKGTPTVGEIVIQGMKEARGVVALFTPDEYAVLRPQNRSPHDKGELVERWQSRPNVIFEAGMAFGRDRERVVFVTLGNVSLFTDVAGVHTLRPKNDPRTDRSVLRKTLKAMGCAVDDSDDWMHHGDFEKCVDVKELPEVLPRDPFQREFTS